MGRTEAMNRGQKTLSPPVALDWRDPIMRPDFILAMLNELASGEAKYGRGSWNRLRYKSEHEAIREFEDHFQKLFLALTSKNKAKIREHCADLANIAMKTEETFGPDSP